MADCNFKRTKVFDKKTLESKSDRIPFERMGKTKGYIVQESFFFVENMSREESFTDIYFAICLDKKNSCRR